MNGRPTGDVVIEFIDTAGVPDSLRRDNKVFESGTSAVIMKQRGAVDGPVLCFTAAEELKRANTEQNTVAEPVDDDESGTE